MAVQMNAIRCSHTTGLLLNNRPRKSADLQNQPENHHQINNEENIAVATSSTYMVEGYGVIA